MSEDPKQDWSEVGDRASVLARLVSERLKGVTAASSSSAGASPKAFDRMAAIASELAARASSAARDPEVRDQLSGLGGSINTAVNSTVERVGSTVDARLKRRPKDPDS